MAKPLLCKLGFHIADKEYYYVRHNHRGVVTSRSAFCKRCGKRLYLVDKYGKKKHSHMNLWIKNIIKTNHLEI